MTGVTAGRPQLLISRLHRHGGGIIQRRSFGDRTWPPINRADRTRAERALEDRVVTYDRKDLLRRQNVYPGDHVLAWCDKHNIGLPVVAALKCKLSPNTFKLTASISHQHCIESTVLKYFDRFEHPLTLNMFDIYEAKQKAPLWTYAWGGMGLAGNRAMVASTAKRRLKHAMKDALAGRGYDGDGRRLPTTPEEVATPELFGTLKIQTAEAKSVCNAKFADVLKDVDFIIGEALVHLRRGGNNWRPQVSSSRPPQKQQQQQQRRQQQQNPMNRNNGYGGNGGTGKKQERRA